MVIELHPNEVNDKILNNEDYRQIYIEMQERNSELEQELAFHRVELEKFKSEAVRAYMLSKMRQQDNANLATQADKILKDALIANKDLRNRVRELADAKHIISEAYKGTINKLVLASEYKDNETGNHILRMGRYCVLIGELYGFDSGKIAELELAAPMHDVGKIGIRDCILFKNGKLTDEEFDEMKRHTIIGANILKNSDSPILECARQIALYHHEKWNGRGYPYGLKGDAIPIQARIVAISDTFDALTSKRPYKKPYPIEVSCDIIKAGRGEDFDPDLVDLFLANIDRFITIKNEIDDNALDEVEIQAQFSWSERDEHDKTADIVKS